MARPQGTRGSLSSTRSKARRAALDLLFEAEQRGVNAASLLSERLAKPVGEAALRPYTSSIVTGVVDHWADLNELITQR